MGLGVSYPRPISVPPVFNYTTHTTPYIPPK